MKVLKSHLFLINIRFVNNELEFKNNESLNNNFIYYDFVLKNMLPRDSLSFLVKKCSKIYCSYFPLTRSRADSHKVRQRGRYSKKNVVIMISFCFSQRYEKNLVWANISLQVRQTQHFHISLLLALIHNSIRCDEEGTFLCFNHRHKQEKIWCRHFKTKKIKTKKKECVTLTIVLFCFFVLFK